MKVYYQTADNFLSEEDKDKEYLPENSILYVELDSGKTVRITSREDKLQISPVENRKSRGIVVTSSNIEGITELKVLNAKDTYHTVRNIEAE